MIHKIFVCAMTVLILDRPYFILSIGNKNDQIVIVDKNISYINWVPGIPIKLPTYNWIYVQSGFRVHRTIKGPDYQASTIVRVSYNINLVLNAQVLNSKIPFFMK